eukprot:7114548-Pyramimonas_sp.AAC.1
MDVVASARIEGDVATAVGIVNSLPGHAVMGVEIQFASHYLKMMQSYSRLVTCWKAAVDAKGRQISSEMVTLVQCLRNDAKVCKDFTRSQSFGPSALFQYSADIAVRLANSRINIAWDLSELPATFAAAEALAGEIVSEWAKNASELVNL